MSETSRREFIKGILKSCGGLAAGGTLLKASRTQATPLPWQGAQRGFSSVKEAMHFKKLEEMRVECQVCPRKCKVADKERGYCGVRENRGGTYYTLVHGNPCSAHVDPIEKKPLFHYYPSTFAFSIATAGCNVECKFCQNWQISQFRPEQVDSFPLPPEGVVRTARESQCRSIAFTYSEPVVFYEYMYDTAKLARQEGIGAVMISNAYINPKPLADLCQHLEAVKVDLKAFTEKYYKEICSGELKPVLEALQELKRLGIWYELVVLIIPTLNDDEAQLRAMCQWVAEQLGQSVPIHFSRFYPQYKIKNLPPTPIKTLEKARAIAMESGLQFAYIGNVPGHPGESTYCPQCQEVLVKRIGYTVVENKIKKSQCPSCSAPVPGIWGREEL